VGVGICVRMYGGVSLEVREVAKADERQALPAPDWLGSSR
jgi:hypothetical protein